MRQIARSSPQFNWPGGLSSARFPLSRLPLCRLERSCISISTGLCIDYPLASAFYAHIYATSVVSLSNWELIGSMATCAIFWALIFERMGSSLQFQPPRLEGRRRRMLAMDHGCDGRTGFLAFVCKLEPGKAEDLEACLLGLTLLSAETTTVPNE